MTWSLKKTKQRKSSAPCCSKARKVLLLMRAVGRGGKVWKWSLEGRFHGGRLGCSRANPSRRRCGATEVAPHATPHLKRGNKSKLQTRCWRCTSDSLPVLCSHLFFFGWSVFNCPCCVCVCVCVSACENGRQAECGGGGWVPGGNEPVRQFCRAVYARTLSGMGKSLFTTCHLQVDRLLEAWSRS